MFFVKYRKIWYAFSMILLLLSVASIVVWGRMMLAQSIDFNGGSLLEVHVSEEPDLSEVRTLLEGNSWIAQVQTTQEQGLLIRTRTLSEQEHEHLLSLLQGRFQQVTELRFDSIGPVIGQELRRTALYGIVFTLILIGLYIAYTFRKVSQPVASWKYGLITVFKSFHDVILALGSYAFVGNLLHWDVGATLVAAVLTILGYAINDSVVVLDRIRETLALQTGGNFEEIVEKSNRATLTRSINTSVTTLLALLAVLFFGGSTTQSFIFAMASGFLFASYSSIFLASPLLVTLQKFSARA